MWVEKVLRKLFLSMALGGHSIFGIGMSQEKIEELLHAMHQTRIEMTISEEEKNGKVNQWMRKTLAQVKELLTTNNK
jgi:hypothetical protein